MKKYIILNLLIFSVPAFSANGLLESRILAFGGISFTFICIFLYLVYDYTSVLKKKNDESETNTSSVTEVVNFGEEFTRPELRPVIRRALYKTARNILEENDLLQTAEFILKPENQAGLKIQKNGSIFVLSRLQILPEEEILNPLKSGMIVKEAAGAFLPVVIPGFLSWIFIPGGISESQITEQWEVSKRLAEEFSLVFQEEMEDIDLSCGLYNLPKLHKDMRFHFSSSLPKFLLLVQIHGNSQPLGQAIKKIKTILPDVYMVSSHTLAFFQNSQQMQDIQNSISEMVVDLKREGNQISFSVGACEKGKRELEEWYQDAEKALRKACIQGPDYFYQL